MTQSKNRIYYVYIHKEPVLGEIVYVGKGCRERAWSVTRNRSYNKPHLDWMEELIQAGCLPDEWVRILESRLTEEEAFKTEKEYLYKNGCPRFNNQSGEKQHQAKLTNDQAREIFVRAKTEKHKDLAEEFGVSRTCVSMISSRKQWKAVTYDL